MKLFPPILSIALAVSVLCGCEEEKEEDKSDLFKVPVQVQTPSVPNASPGEAAVPAQVQTVAPKAGNLVPYLKNVKSVSRQVAIEQLKAGNYFESIVSEVEGFRPNFYRDNIGVATGNGWNVSMQSQKTNQVITSSIGMSPSDGSQIIAISGNKAPSPSQVPRTNITPAQATRAAQVMRDMNFEPVAVRALGADVWQMLTPYQKAVVSYHVYKTGNLNWPNLKASIKACAKTQDKALCKKAADGFTYSYMMKGERRYDTRSQLYMGALFQDPQAYAYLLGTQAAPGNFSAITSSSGMKIDATKPADPQVEAQDTFTPIKEEMIEEGQVFELNVVTPVIEMPPKKVAPALPKHHLPTGYIG